MEYHQHLVQSEWAWPNKLTLYLCRTKVVKVKSILDIHLASYAFHIILGREDFYPVAKVKSIKTCNNIGIFVFIKYSIHFYPCWAKDCCFKADL